MIYRHYKGGLYFLNGYATPFSDKFYDKTKVTTNKLAEAIYEPTLEKVDVIAVYDSDVNSTYYAYDNSDLQGVLCFYRGLDGLNWLRPREAFHEEIKVLDEGRGDYFMMPRFEKVSGEYLFDSIVEMKEKISNRQIDKCNK